MTENSVRGQNFPSPLSCTWSSSYCMENVKAVKVRSHGAYGRETDKKSFHQFVSGRNCLMSVSNPVNPFLVG